LAASVLPVLADLLFLRPGAPLAAATSASSLVLLVEVDEFRDLIQ